MFKLLSFLSPFNIFLIPLPFFLPPSYLLITLPPCSSPFHCNNAADLLHLNSAAYLSIQVLQSCMIPVTWQPLWESSVSTEDRWSCKSWFRGWVKESMGGWKKGLGVQNEDSWHSKDKRKSKSNSQSQNSHSICDRKISQILLQNHRSSSPGPFLLLCTYNI